MSTPRSVFVLTAVILASCTVRGIAAQSPTDSIRVYNYATCQGRKTPSGVMGNFTVTSRLSCVRACTKQPGCLSCTYCRVGERRTCALSTHHQLACPALTNLDSHCSVAELVARVCQNGGQLDKMNMTCQCKPGWTGRDCETGCKKLEGIWNCVLNALG